MRLFPGFVFVLTLLQGLVVHAQGAKPGSTSGPKGAVEAASRLQVFLDRAEFAPGKIDGRYGEFTLQALALYREAQGSTAQPVPDQAKTKAKRKKGAGPDVSGLDLAGIDPVFITYSVTEPDLQTIGEMPETVPAQAALKVLPYKDAAEAIAEKFHCDRKFLGELNPGKTEAIKAGDQLLVPNVEPFELASVKAMKPGDEIGDRAANDIDADAVVEPEGKGKTKADKDKKSASAEAAPVTTEVKVDIKSNTVRVHESGKLIAAYPVTVGSTHTESPVGDWKVKGFEKMPAFRYDTSMLEKGERSADFHMLPAGPNNPVGVMWIALNKKGIGLHGTSDPDSIGRSASHGCIRLANWDVVRLARKIKFGVPVTIH